MRWKTYLPRVTSTNVTSQGGPSPQEQAVLTLMQQHPEQRRKRCVWSEKLTEAARARARDMAVRQYFSHTDPDGVTPNEYARRAGYKLPDWYPDKGNQIESIGGGFPTANDAWAWWLKSPAHRTHMLGESSFYADQHAIGIGYVRQEGAPYVHYWVLLSAPLESN